MSSLRVPAATFVRVAVLADQEVVTDVVPAYDDGEEEEEECGDVEGRCEGIF